MVAWYKHDIPAWMDATEALDDGPYRVYHVVCQLIYLNEGPIRLNEKGIAGRCNMHVLSFRSHLNLLLTLGRLTLDPSGTISQPRADLELEKIGQNRVNAGLGGSKSRKPLKSKEPDQAPLKSEPSINITEKTREEKTREEKTRQDDTLPSVALRADGSTRSEPALKIKVAPRLVLDSNADETKPKKRPRALPPDWKPSVRSYALAEQFGQNVQIVEGIFRDYCASSGKLYADHDAAFHNFIRNQSNFHRGSGNGIRQNEAAGRGSIVNAADRAIQNLEREIAADNEAREGVILSLPSQRL